MRGVHKCKLLVLTICSPTAKKSSYFSPKQRRFLHRDAHKILTTLLDTHILAHTHFPGQKTPYSPQFPGQEHTRIATFLCYRTDQRNCDSTRPIMAAGPLGKTKQPAEDLRGPYTRKHVLKFKP